MSKIVRVQEGDYKLIVGSNNAIGNIVLDTNPGNLIGANGGVTITGDLTVLGNTTTIQSETLTITDPIIYINTSGNGFPGGSHLSGIQINRGSELDPPEYPVSLYWDENLGHYDLATSSTVLGTFKLVKDDVPEGTLQTLAVSGISTNGGDLALISTGTGIISVAGTNHYEEQIIDYDLVDVIFDIVTIGRHNNVATVEVSTIHNLAPMQRVNLVCATDGTFNGIFIQVLATPTDTTFTYVNVGGEEPTKSVLGNVKPDIIRDDDSIPNMRAVADYALNATKGIFSNKIQEDATKVQTYGFNTSGVDKIEFEINGDRRALLASTGLTVDNIRIVDNNISNTSNDNILFNNVLSIPNRVSKPTTPGAGYVKLYSKNQPGTGGTGLFFVNTQGTNDELISKTKALLYSLIL